MIETFVFDTTYEKPSNLFHHGQRVTIVACGNFPERKGIIFGVHGRSGSYWYEVCSAHDGCTSIEAIPEGCLTAWDVCVSGAPPLFVSLEDRQSLALVARDIRKQVNWNDTIGLSTGWNAVADKIERIARLRYRSGFDTVGDASHTPPPPTEDLIEG